MLDASVFTTVRDVFSVIGVFATAGALAWRVFAWRHHRKTHLKVSVANAFPIYEFGPDVPDWCFSVTAVNQGDHPVVITSAGFALPDGRDLVLVHRPFPDALPCSIPARDSRQTWARVESLEAQGVDVEGSIRGFVQTSTGKRFESRGTVLTGP